MPRRRCLGKGPVKPSWDTPGSSQESRVPEFCWLSVSACDGSLPHVLSSGDMAKEAFNRGLSTEPSNNSLGASRSVSNTNLLGVTHPALGVLL